MAPMRMAAPRTKRAPQNLTNIGVEGRATALTMAERPKDEHGLELMDSWYSSPVTGKSQRTRSSSRATLNGMVHSSEAEDTTQIPHTNEFQSSAPDKLTREMRTSLPPPPRARSPIKTSIGATPVRGTPRSTARVPSSRSPDPSLVKSPRRLLDFSTSDTSRSSLRSESRTRKSNARLDMATPRAPTGGALSRQTSPGLTPSAEVNQDLSKESEDNSALENSVNDSPPPEMGDDQPEPQLLDDGHHFAMDDPNTMPNTELEQSPEQASGSEEADITIVSIENFPNENSRNVSTSSEGEQASAAGEREITSPPNDPKRKPFSQKDPNQKRKKQPKPIKAPQPKTISAARALQRKRAQTPAEEDGVLQTRFGRNVYKPLAYWKGEHALFEEHTYQQNLKQIIRMEEVTPQKRPTKNRKRKRACSVFEDPSVEEQAEEEAWEISEGTVSAPVRTWDSDVGAAPPETEFEQQLAFASARIQPRASPDNPNFFFTKTLTMPFFGAGVIEIPPGGHKGLKNSRKFQFIFFVHYGKVQVEVAGTSFTISKGGMWQVPRGNFYSMSNQTEHPAKIFFAQSCELQPEPASLPPLLENLN